MIRTELQQIVGPPSIESDLPALSVAPCPSGTTAKIETQARAACYPFPPNAPVAAIIPCHNYGRFLRQCLDSVATQTRPFDEVIIVDDDSSDDTPQIAQELCKDRPGWKYLRVKLGMGPLS